MECAWCSEQLLALEAAPHWGQSCFLGCALQGCGPFSSLLLEKEREGRKRKGKKKKAFLFRLKKRSKHLGSKLKNPENSENIENF